jgi:CelD/BcsL family acetyltransferase involved in cellulose biosynthesis
VRFALIAPHPLEPLRGHLLLQVVGDVGVEHAGGTAPLVDPRQGAVVEQAVEVEVAAELARREPVELVAHGAASEEVRGTALHLACARPAEGEVEPAVLDQPVHARARWNIDLKLS